MRHIEYTSQFKRDIKRAKKRRLPLPRLKAVMDLIIACEPLPERYRDHALVGNWYGCRELHILPDWLLIYKFVDGGDTVIFVRVGTHADLFE